MTIIRPAELSVSTSVDTDPMTHAAVPITVARGDGIGPEIMDACLAVFAAAGAQIKAEVHDIGLSAYKRGHAGGLTPDAWASLERTRVLFKAPVATPQGSGMKSLNVTLRKSFGLFANVRPCVSYHPFVATLHPAMDVVIVRENEEDVYAGIEHRQTNDVVQCLKLITRPGCERIVRYAFGYAKAHGRKRVTCFTKDNIMKLSDGLFHQVFNEVAKEFPEITADHMIVDIGAARLAASPERFDVIVMPNLYGDILSDVAAEIAGSVGLAGSANIGLDVAMFEAVHGTAPDIAGKDIANPSGLLLAGVQMLQHLGQGAVAERIHNAWLRTIEDGIHTADIYTGGVSAACVGTKAFTDAVIARLGQPPRKLKPAHHGGTPVAVVEAPAKPRQHKAFVGIDIFVDAPMTLPGTLAKQVNAVDSGDLGLTMITNRGLAVWPASLPHANLADHWRCRFQAAPGTTGDPKSAAQLVGRLMGAGLDVIKTEHLYTFDGVPGFSVGQGQ